MNDTLSQKIEALYAAFASVPKPKVIDHCPCCLDEEEVGILLCRPLREIAPEELSSYASSAFLTVGAEADFHYLLPRILEITVTTQWWWPSFEVTGRAMASGRWTAWPAHERSAILDLLNARFDELMIEREGFDLNSWLCGLARAGVYLNPYLGKLGADARACLGFYRYHANEIMENTLASGFWDDAPAGIKQVVDWFHSPEVAQLVLDAYGVELNNRSPAK